ncbi:hypothetical protein ERO13_A07G178450v2 [Gossypium hirsutum]|uniref:Uncharacterized protein n=3 Tax=Gossypium TaxID=3633 RepID=A0A5J5V6S1_GOSBA|nr:hypothetical protein ES319_A07G193200v1 [Gossypium barbadense]KAG4192786.1 hypothetical protein ERO13_A07G178450v2 [Gossypium hirsutum]TYH10847.1 hypothetical protein ES288_A07G209800v1 [Gossypium darwinii]TYI20050.1 hypothetical protein ES332_A07G207600v1 [Gossypium tomentosum]KAB2075048.1 hypothetical protein ES319_A07G193200v1 [Gossypium barbadense]
MDMLPSFILYPLINGGSHLSNFHSFSSSSNTIATHIEALSNKPMSMPVRGKGKRDHRFDNVDDTLIFFSAELGNGVENNYMHPLGIN